MKTSIAILFLKIHRLIIESISRRITGKIWFSENFCEKRKPVYGPSGKLSLRFLTELPLNATTFSVIFNLTFVALRKA